MNLYDWRRNQEKEAVRKKQKESQWPKQAQNKMDMEADSLGGRLIRYTANMVALSGRMPSGQASQELATGLLQAVMGLLPRYHAACEMDSDRAFSRKMRQCRRMLRDARVWLSVIEKSGLLPHERIQGIQGETVVMEATFSRIIHEIERRLV